MWTHLSEKTVKARKEHRCILCGLTIHAGRQYIRRVGVVCGDGFHTMKMHPQCEMATHNWTQWDWENGYDEWTFKHEELLPETLAELMADERVTAPERGGGMK